MTENTQEKSLTSSENTNKQPNTAWDNWKPIKDIDQVSTHEKQQEWLETVRKTEY